MFTAAKYYVQNVYHCIDNTCIIVCVNLTAYVVTYVIHMYVEITYNYTS